MGSFVQDQTFEKIAALEHREYEQCAFRNCNFSESDLSQIKFVECTFDQCNFSNCNITKTAFRQVKFKGCKMLGLRFDLCATFGLSFQFEDCMLNHSSFTALEMAKTRFSGCNLQEVDFVEADLTQAVFDNCNLTHAVFERTTLFKADFNTAYGYRIDPEINSIKKAQFSSDGLSGLLAKYDIIIS